MSRVEITKIRSERMDANAALEAKIKELQEMLASPVLSAPKKAEIVAKIESVRIKMKTASEIREKKT